jgi:hypothetical protein
MVNRIRLRRRLPPVDIERSERFTQRLRKELDRWADHLNNLLNVNLLFGRPSYTDSWTRSSACERCNARSDGAVVPPIAKPLHRWRLES